MVICLSKEVVISFFIFIQEKETLFIFFRISLLLPDIMIGFNLYKIFQ